MRALISVSDRSGLESFARGLAELGVELVTTGGGTHEYLESLGLGPVVVDVPRLLGGRVKTLHPRVHAGILARPDRDDDRAALLEHAIEPFEIVCVNFYPFASVASTPGADDEEVVEVIDIGGPSMLRGAAKNFEHVAAVSGPDQYEALLDELRRDGEISLGTRRRLAAEAFVMTALYDAAIAGWFSAGDPFPDRMSVPLQKVADLAYGENPHQRAALYAEVGARRHVLSRVEQLHGKPLTFNNLNDLSAARALLAELTLPACVIVKHANPCGVATADWIEEAYGLALAADPVSAYGGVVALNRPVTSELGERLAAQFVELLFAPGYEDGALEALTAKVGTRILRDEERRIALVGERDFKRVLGGFLVQDLDAGSDRREDMEVVCGTLSEEQWDDLLLAWLVCTHVSSNAIVLARDRQTLGIGAGQMSRVDAVRIAVAKAAEHGHDLAGAALASDAFFPFADGPQLALDAGVRVFVQPGGSKRDAEVVEVVGNAGGSMVFTGRRHFRH